jgi:hypothetical protein
VNCVDDCLASDDAGTSASCAATCTAPYGADQGVIDYETLAMCQQTTCGNFCN